MTDEAGDELMVRIRQGDREAFALLYRRYRPEIYRFAVHFSGCPAAAEDVVQDVFVAVLQDVSRYRAERSGVLPWLLGIARNYARRRRSERPLLPLPIDDTPSARELAVHDDPLRAILRDREAAALRRALRDLPARYREIVILCDVQDLTYLEAASVLGCAVGTVRSRLHRARARLARLVSDAREPIGSRLPATRAVL